MSIKKNVPPRRTLVDLPISTTTPQTEAATKSLNIAASEDRVLVNAPNGFTLTLDDGTPVPVRKGVQMMQRDLVDHWYAKANGVALYDPDAADGTGTPA